MDNDSFLFFKIFFSSRTVKAVLWLAMTLWPAFLVVAQKREIIELNEKWIVGEADENHLKGNFPVDFRNPGEGWYPATMPRQIQDILFERGMIPDPHIGTNPVKCTWVFGRDWIYATRFNTPVYTDSVFLCFDGIDTKASIVLNGKPVGEVGDMFRRYRFEISSLLHKDHGSNLLSIVVRSPEKFVNDIMQKEGVAANYARKYLRKTGCDFTSYMGATPNFLKMGIFSKVYLDMTGKSYLGDPFIRTMLNNDFNSARIMVFPDVKGYGNPRISYNLTGPDGKIVKKDVVDNCESFHFTVENPELWWPYTSGNPALYNLTISLLSKGMEIDRKTIRVGIRDVKLVTKDPQTGEERFGFRINGQMIFMRGGCWAPLEGMTHVWNQQRAKKLLDIFQLGKFNFTRVWGEGELPDDWFYDECDRRGILVWQEFMTANGMQFPLNYEGYTENFRQEITDNIKRFRNHPCIINWCGGNEHYLNNRVVALDRNEPLGRVLLEEIMPELVKKYDPDRYFHPSSPWGGADWADGNDPLEGDWHDYSTYRYQPLTTVPLFGSEICMVSPYSLHNMRKYLTDEEIWPAGFSFRIDKPGKIGWPEAWQYHTASNGWQKTGKFQDYLDIQNAGDMCRVFGTAHGEYLRDRFERMRRGVPDGFPDGNRRSWGACVWRFNDTWPMIYMSVIDYYLEPKIPYYFLKRACEPVLISFEMRPEKICAWIINDSPNLVSDSLVVELKTFSGILRKRIAIWAELQPSQSKRVIDLTVFGEIVKRGEFLTARFGDQMISQLLYPEKFLLLPDTNIKAERTSQGIILSSDKFVKDVALSMENGSGAVFDDNYFNLLPGISKLVKIIDSAGGNKLSVKGVNSELTEISL